MKNKAFSDFFCYFAFVNFLFGAKLWLIRNYANQTPFWDQWLGEAAYLYKPFFDGTLHFSFFFSPSNEHRILTTRLLDLAELVLNGIWNPLLQMVVNAALHVAALTLTVALMARVLGRAYLPALLSFSALVFALPNGWESTLWGFESQFYFVVVFSVAGLWLSTTIRPFSAGWWFGLFCCVLAFFSMAPGVFCFSAAAGMGLLFYLLHLRRTRLQAGAAFLLFGLFIGGVLLTPGAVGGEEGTKAHSALQFLGTLARFLSWPSPYKILGLLQILPAVVFGIHMVRTKPPATDPKWFLAAILAWMLGAESGMAYGRPGPPASRYLDFLSVLVLATFACFLLIVKESAAQWKKWLVGGLALWILCVGVCLQTYNAQNTQSALRNWKKVKRVEEVNTRNYVATGDRSYLKNKPLYDLPLPWPEVLAPLLDSPEIRRILPANIAPPDRPVKEGRLDGWVNALLGLYGLFGGMALLAAVAAVWLRRRFPGDI